MRRIDSQRQGQTAIQIQPTEVGLGEIDHLITMWIEAVDEVAQGGGLSHTGFACKQTYTRAMQEPLEALAQLRERAIVPQLRGVLAERRVTQSEVFAVHVIFPP